MNLAEFSKRYDVKMRCSPGAPVNWDFPHSDGWIVHLFLGKTNRYCTVYFTGVGCRKRSWGNKNWYGHYDRRVMLGQVKLPDRHLTAEGEYVRAVEALYGDLLVRPQVEDVLGSILDDLSVFQCTGSFEFFCKALGYAEESGSAGEAERVWARVQQQERDVRRWLGPRYDTFLACERV